MRNPNGYGSISKLSGNRRRPYIVRITKGFTLKGYAVAKIIGYFKTKKEASMALAEYNKNPQIYTASQFTFSDVWQMYVKQRYTDTGIKIPNGYSAAFQWCTSLHTMKMVDIKLMHLQDVVNNCTANFSTKKNIKIVENQLFKYAIGNDIVTTNYAELVKLPTEEKSDLHKEFTEAEIKLLWEHQDNIAAKICLILIYTGMRSGSLREMKTENIHLREQYMVGGVKNAGAKNRNIPIADCILPLVEYFYNPQNEFLLGKKVMPYDTLKNNYFTPIIKELSMKHRLHDGRVTCETILDRLKVQRSVIDAILGHASKSIGEKYYRKVTIKDRLEAVNQIPHWNDRIQQNE